MTCNHDEPHALKETLREHMIRAHGWTEPMVIYWMFFKGLGGGVRAAELNRAAGNILVVGDLERLLELMDPLSAAGFRLGFVEGAAWESLGERSC